MSCNIGDYNTGISPICIPASQFQPNVIQCPQLQTSEVQSPLCDLLPTITSLTDFLINLPFLMLFIVSLPARFLYCMAYQFLVNADNIIDFLIYYILYPAVDFITLPFLYFTIGFNNGLLNNFNLPSQPYGFVNACFFNQIIEKVYEALGDLFYIIGFVLGFFSSLFYKLYNLIIDVVCYLAFFSFCISVGICINLPVTIQIGRNSGTGNASGSNCKGLCIQPFGFLQYFLKGFVNCACALGDCPQIGLNLTIPIGNCSASSCGGEDVFPPCLQYNLNPVQQSNQTFTTPNLQTSE
jgi:hypothetical protein